MTKVGITGVYGSMVAILDVSGLHGVDTPEGLGKMVGDGLLALFLRSCRVASRFNLALRFWNQTCKYKTDESW